MPALDSVEYNVSVPVAVALYYNAMFSALYGIVSSILVLQKLGLYELYYSLQKMLLMPIVIVWVFAEVARLYSGFCGNSKESVPQMSAFLLLTIFPQFPCVIFLGFLQEQAFPFDQVAGVIMCAFLITEFAFGWISLQALIRRQTAQFYRLCQAEEHSSENPQHGQHNPLQSQHG